MIPTYKAAWECKPSRWDRLLGRTWIVTATPTHVPCPARGTYYDRFEAVPFNITQQKAIAFGPVTRRFAKRKVRDQAASIQRYLGTLP